MKYLCLCYYDTQKVAAWSQADMDAVPEACKPHDKALHETGKLALVGSLDFPEAWKTIRPANGQPIVSDGPYSNSRDQAGAFFIVEAANMEEAVKVASKHPGANLGTYFGGGIEVRACDSYEEL